MVEKSPGLLHLSLTGSCRKLKLEGIKRDALREMAKRLDIQDFTTFIGAIIQADQFGVGIAQVLRIQSEQIRLKRNSAPRNAQ